MVEIAMSSNWFSESESKRQNRYTHCLRWMRKEGKRWLYGGKELEETHEVSPPSVLVSPYRLLGFSRACVWGYGEEGDQQFRKVIKVVIFILSSNLKENTHVLDNPGS